MTDHKNQNIQRPTDEQLTEFFYSSLDMLCIAGQDGYLKAVNPAFVKTFGYSADELLSKPYLEFVHPEDLSATKKQLEKLAKGDDALTFECRIVKKDGSHRWLLWSCPAPKDKGGLMYASARDITEKKDLQESLQSKEIQFYTLVENIPGIVYRCACDSDWTMEFISDYIKELTGYPSSDFIDNKKRSYASIIHPNDAPMVENVVLDAVGERQPFVIEYRICHKDGSIRWVFERGRAVYDRQGRISWLDGVILDITKRKQNDESYRLMAKFPDENPHGVLRLSPEGVVLYHNRAALPFLLAIGTKLGQTMPENWPMQVRITLEKKSPKKMDVDIKGHNFTVYLVPITSFGENKFVYVYISDISELKTANRDLTENEKLLRVMVKDYQKTQKELVDTQLQLMQSEKLKVVGRMAAGVAHEVKNPLAIIMQGAEYLSRKGIKKDKNFDLTIKDIREAVERADVVIKGMLDFSSMSKLELKLGDLNEVIEDSLRLTKFELESAKVEVKKDFQKNLKDIMLDKQKMEQVFVNIFMNALQAMPDGGVINVKTYKQKVKEESLGVGRRREDPLRPGDTAAYIEIHDTGQGIPEEALDKVFDPFFTTKQGKDGSGLGLTVIENIIHLHHGVIKIANHPKGGAVVTIVFKI